jgi:hypothetical protein
VHLECNLFLVNRQPCNATDGHRIIAEFGDCDWTETAVNVLWIRNFAQGCNKKGTGLRYLLRRYRFTQGDTPLGVLVNRRVVHLRHSSQL